MTDNVIKKDIYKDFTLLVDGKTAFPKILECIGRAKEYIYINMFIWRDDKIGNKMARALLKAADRGVRVFISVDRYGVVLEKSEESGKSFFHKTQTPKEKIKYNALKLCYPKNSRKEKTKDTESEIYRIFMTHPNITVSRSIFKADHSKYYIIDNEILFVGGMNIEDKELGKDIAGREYGDYMAMITGKKYVKAFRAKLTKGLDVSDYFFFGVNTKAPLRECFEMEKKYLDMIESANKELHITMAYFSPLKKFVNAIIAAYNRGVDVTVIIPSDANYQDSSNKKTVKKLLKATKGGIRVFLSPRMLHTKLVVNENYISFGSTNITKKAFHQLSELNLFLKNENSAFRNDIYNSIAHDIEESKEIKSYKDIKYNRILAFFEGFLV